PFQGGASRRPAGEVGTVEVERRRADPAFEEGLEETETTAAIPRRARRVHDEGMGGEGGRSAGSHSERGSLSRAKARALESLSRRDAHHPERSREGSIE